MKENTNDETKEWNNEVFGAQIKNGMVSWFGKVKENRSFKEINGLEEYRNSVDDALLPHR